MGDAVKMTGTGADVPGTTGAVVEGESEESAGEDGIGAVLGAGTKVVVVGGVSVRGEFVAGDVAVAGVFVTVTTGETAGTEVAGAAIGKVGTALGVEI